MTERERLVELLIDYPCMSTAEENFIESIAADLADYLLANGIVVLPCTVGDTVYIIDNRDMLNIDPSVCSVVDDEIYEMGYGRTQSGELKWLFLVCETGEDFYDDDIGKTVFLTCKEAEKALAERSKE